MNEWKLGMNEWKKKRMEDKMEEKKEGRKNEKKDGIKGMDGKLEWMKELYSYVLFAFLMTAASFDR